MKYLVAVLAGVLAIIFWFWFGQKNTAIDGETAVHVTLPRTSEPVVTVNSEVDNAVEEAGGSVPAQEVQVAVACVLKENASEQVFSSFLARHQYLGLSNEELHTLVQALRADGLAEQVLANYGDKVEASGDRRFDTTQLTGESVSTNTDPSEIAQRANFSNALAATYRMTNPGDYRYSRAEFDQALANFVSAYRLVPQQGLALLYLHM